MIDASDEQFLTWLKPQQRRDKLILDMPPNGRAKIGEPDWDRRIQAHGCA